MLWSWPQLQGTDWETGRGGYWAVTWPRGCLFKPKSCLDYCTQILLLYCSCMRHKARKQDRRRAKKRRQSKGGLDNVIPRSQETALTIRKYERAQWNRGRGDKV